MHICVYISIYNISRILLKYAVLRCSFPPDGQAPVKPVIRAPAPRRARLHSNSNSNSNDSNSNSNNNTSSHNNNSNTNNNM